MYKQVGRSNVPWKVLRHFPFTFWLECMYNTLAQVEFMIWYANNRSWDGLMRHTIDSKQWVFIDKKWPSFGNEPINVWLGLFTDGLNPFGEKHSTWSLWLMLLVNYNIPPRLITKRHFIMLSLIIPRPIVVATLALGSRPRQGFTRLQAKREVGSHTKYSRECEKVWGNEPSYPKGVPLWGVGVPVDS